MTEAATASLAAMGAITLLACWFDIRERRLPNWLVLATAALGLGIAGWQQGIAVLPWHLAHLAVALAVGIGLYAIRALGAGDAKFYAAVAAWFPLAAGIKLLMAASLAGLGFALGWLVWRRIKGNPPPRKPVKDMDKLPFGVAIALGGLLALLY
jgi:prepilin peptidase CpaA